MIGQLFQFSDMSPKELSSIIDLDIIVLLQVLKPLCLYLIQFIVCYVILFHACWCDALCLMPRTPRYIFVSSILTAEVNHAAVGSDISDSSSILIAGIIGV